MNTQSVALVDLGYLFTRNYRGAGIGAPPNAGAERTLEDLASIDGDVHLMVVCIDAPPYRRRDRYPEYKAQREEQPPEERAQKKAVIEEIKRRGYITAKVQGYEADDIIATLATQFSVTHTDVRIVASDKDCAQLITDRVVQFVPPSGDRQTEKRDAEACFKKFKVWPNEMVLWQALVGDSSDNVPGVPGVGPKKAADIVLDLKASGKPPTLEGLALYMGEEVRPGAMWKSIAEHWEDLRLSYELVTLDRNAPVQAAELFGFPQPGEEDDIRPDPVPSEPPPVANDTKGATPPTVDRKVAAMNTTPIGKHATEAEIDQTVARIAAVNEQGRNPPGAAKVTEAEFDPISRAPGATGIQPAMPPKAARATPPKPVEDQEYGLVTADLQPLDLRSARQLSKWIAAGGLYKSFGTPEQIFSIILRGKELGLGVTTALAGFHVIEGKPSASADLIRSLAVRDPDCEYFMLVESSPTSATWETKHRRHPRPTVFTYTIEEARLIPEYWKKDRWGGPSQWEKRPRDMLTKTAGSKLARLVYPGAVLGLYCPEELGAIDTVGEAA